MPLNIVLVEPEIPPNTGNIARTCTLTGTSLHLIEPFGFKLDQKEIRRAGLDYWKQVDLHVYPSFQHFLDKHGHCRLFCATTKANRFYTDFTFQLDDYFIFGKESKGLNEEILYTFSHTQLRIPMLPLGRSLNLSNAANIILYEALRQNKFPNFG